MMIIEICNKRIDSNEAADFILYSTQDRDAKKLKLRSVSGGEIFLFQGTEEQCKSIVKRPECQKLLKLIEIRETRKVRTHQG